MDTRFDPTGICELCYGKEICRNVFPENPFGKMPECFDGTEYNRIIVEKYFKGKLKK